jgi:hypothetical protein
MGANVRIQSFPATPAGPRAPDGGAGGAPPPDATFAEAWRERLSRTRHANFTLSLDYLAHQAERGEASLAVLIDEGPRRGAMVLREAGSKLVSGTPWRWQIVIEDADPLDPRGMTQDDAVWFFGHAQRLAGGRRLRFFAPHPLRSALSYLAARTVFLDLAHSTEEQLWAAMDPSRRRMVRRSGKQGYEVIEGDTPELQRSFDEQVAETGARRHGLRPGNDSGPEVARGWGLPWHWLLVVVRDGAVVAGLGLGRHPGGTVDGRASCSSEQAMKAGTNSQVWWESVRQARLAGHNWMNLGGSTIYKREFGGVLVPIYCRLGGGPLWWVPNLLEKLRREGIAFAVKAHRRFPTSR